MLNTACVSVEVAVRLSVMVPNPCKSAHNCSSGTMCMAVGEASLRDCHMQAKVMQNMGHACHVTLGLQGS